MKCWEGELIQTMQGRGVPWKIFLGPTGLTHHGLSLQMQMYLQLSLLSHKSNNQKLSLCASCAGLILIQNC